MYASCFACFAEFLATVLPSSDLELLQNDCNNMEPYKKLKLDKKATISSFDNPYNDFSI